MAARRPENAGRDDIAQFFREVMAQDSERAARRHAFLEEMTGSADAGPALS